MRVSWGASPWWIALANTGKIAFKTIPDGGIQMVYNGPSLLVCGEETLASDDKGPS